MKQILMIALGGGLGSVLRYLSQKWIYQVYPSVFPWGTLTVNVAGSFLIGIFWALASRESGWSDSTRLLLITGICGGFTTFSAFSLEGLELIRQERFLAFLMYFAMSIILGLTAAFLGIRLVK